MGPIYWKNAKMIKNIGAGYGPKPSNWRQCVGCKAEEQFIYHSHKAYARSMK